MKLQRLFTFAWQYSVIALLCFSMVTMTACSVDQVLSDIDIALQTSQTIEAAIGVVLPGDAAIIEGLTGLAISGINAIKQDYDTYEATKSGSALQKMLDAAEALKTNLPANLAAAHIYSPDVQAKCTAWVNLVVSTLQTIINAMPSVTSSSVAMVSAKTRTLTISLPTPESLQARWQAEVCGGDVACGKLVKVHHKHLPWNCDKTNHSGGI